MISTRLRKVILNFYGALGSLTIVSPIQIAADVTALIGGQNLTGSDPAYVALVSSSGELTPLTFSGGIATTGRIASIAINSSGNGIIGGGENGTGTGPAYAALVSRSGSVTPLTLPVNIATHGFIHSVAINASGNGIIGGWENSISTGPAYTALVSSSGGLTNLIFSGVMATTGLIESVAINSSGNGIIGGEEQDASDAAYAAFVFAGDPNPSPFTFSGGMETAGEINTVAINSSGNGIIGGQNLDGPSFTEPAYAAFVSAGNPNPSPFTFSGGMAMDGNIASVAINSSGNGIIGGEENFIGSGPAYAALVFAGNPTPALLPLPTGMATSGVINSVAINFYGNGVIGGEESPGVSGPAYAALVSPSGELKPLIFSGNMAASGTILSVAINSAGNGIIGGYELSGSQPAYAALFTSAGVLVPLTFSDGMATSGFITSVALLDYIPTSSLSGNNLKFANYINEFAPENSFYFIAATLDGTLNAALESAAPTRNAVSIYTASNNLFDLTTSFANHIRNQRSEGPVKNKKSVAMGESEVSPDELSADLFMQKKRRPSLDNPYSIWFEAIGALAYQKAQKQTVGFSPTTGGAMLSCDYKITKQLRAGGGISYLFTHIHEKEGAGHSNINQEEAFVYTSWDNQQFYVDALLMGGAVQINQVRNIEMTGFSFRSTSHPNGWQLLPHLELGFKHSWLTEVSASRFCPNVFIMLDWANAWQGSYKEKGNGPFNAAQKSYYGSLLRTEAGLRFYETFFFTSWDFIIQEKISYVNTHSFHAGRVNAFLVGSPGSFTVETLSSAANLGVAQLAMSFDPLSAAYPTTTLFYQGEFGSKYQSHQVNVELAWQF